MAFLRSNQLSIMLYMSGACGVLAFMTLMTDSISRRRKCILALMELSAMLLLLFDRDSYLYRGNMSALGFYMVRIGNGMVFFMEIFIPHLVTQYLKDVYRSESGLRASPACLRICDLLFVLGAALLIVSQFTGLYYTFDAQNTYQRAPAYALCYVAPVLIVLLQETTIFLHRKLLSRKYTVSLAISIGLPTVSSIIHIFHFGISLTNMITGLVVITFYLYALNDLSKRLERARKNELESYKAAERTEAAMFEQTAEALANAIDAKDKYTHGHSTRVAALSRQIAREAGYSDKDCRQIYFAALLHDVGKIGVPDGIINKVGKLSEDEFAQIRLHPILGNHILSSIKQSPALSIGARYHHERYDGTGYPDGLSGEQIPDIARIIAVADAYDAMTSTRSYRGSLPCQNVRKELADGMGKQFDPRYAEILLRLIERDEA